MTGEEIKKEEEEYKDKIMELLKEHFRPEFLNRIDEICIFNPLKPSDIMKIVELQLALVKDKLAERGVALVFNAAAKKYIAENGFDPEFGARPVKRLIQKMVLDKLADHIIRGELKNGSRVKVDLKGNSLVFSS